MSTKKIIAMSAPVVITAGEVDGEKKGPAKFNVLAYTGGLLPGALRSGDDHEDVIMDLAGMETGKSLIANLDHEMPQRVGHVNSATHDGKELRLSGIASAATKARDEVVNSAAEGFVWQASIEANPTKLELVKPGSTVKVNGQEFEAPARGGRALYVARRSVLKGFSFVSHGADDNTTVSIAASAAPSKEKKMKAEVQAWAEGMGIDVDNATPELLATIEANYEGKNGKPAKKIEASNPFEARKLEAKRRNDIREIADKFIERRDGDLEFIEAVEKMVDHAIEAKMDAKEFRLEMYESSVPLAHTVPTPRGRSETGMTSRILQAAICQAGRLSTVEKDFTDQELQLARDKFRDGISLNQFFITAAEMNGYRGSSGGRMNQEVQNYAFGKLSAHGRQIQAQGFSTIDVANITGAVANKFIHEGWMGVDQTPLRVAAIKNVRNFQLATTVSLTGALQFTELGAAGEIKHETLDEVIYTNQAKTYAAMLAITRQDIINDDLGALTAVPKRLGRGAMLLLNHIFWTEFLILETDGFFAAGNANINTGVADMTVGGLDATEAIFMAQTDYDGKPLSIQPKILLVPTALRNKALTLMASETAVYATSVATQGTANIFRGRFSVESSPYMSNSAYTGFSAAEWYMLADPNELAVIEIAALNGRVEPTVDTADTDFNTLGVQYRGYSDVGVKRQEKKAGVLADGGAS